LLTEPEERRATVAARALAIAVAVLLCLLVGTAVASTPSGSISGVVRSQNGAPIAGVEVVVDTGSSSPSAFTAADGSYMVNGLAAGSYWVYFAPSNSQPGSDADNYVAQYYEGRDPGSGAPPVSVSGGTNTPGIDATLITGGKVTGVVTDATGTPVAGANVTATAYDGGVATGSGSAQTAVDGSFTINQLPSGYYLVEAMAPTGANDLGDYFGGTTSPAGAFAVAVVAGSTSAGVDLRMPAGGQITGRVRDSSGTPVEGEVVIVQHEAGEELEGTRTAADGTYDLAGLATGSYDVSFNPPNSPPGPGPGPASNYVTQFYDDVGSIAGATPVSVTAGGITSSIDAQVAAGGVIEGTVTDTSGQLITDAYVSVYATDGTLLNAVYANADGAYAIAALPTGTYKIGVVQQLLSLTPGPSPYAPAYYGGTSLATASTISVNAGDTTRGIDMKQATGAVISGTVEDGSGNPLGDIAATAYDAAGEAVGDAGTSSLTGNYSIVGLPAGTYRVGFTSLTNVGDFAPQFSGGASTLASAQTFTVSLGGTAGSVDAQMAPGGEIAGSVTDASGAPIGRLFVNLYDSSGALVGGTEASSDGAFDIPDVGSGTYRVGFSNWPGTTLIENAFYGGATLAAATPISVGAGATTTISNTTLTLVSGAISGVVTDASGNPLAAATVTVYDANGSVVRSGTATASDGTYSIGSLDPGFYRVGFSHGGYVGQMYPDASSFSASQLFYVAAAQTATGIDAALAPAPTAPAGATEPPAPQQPNTETITPPSVSLGRWLLLTATTRATRARGHAFSVRLTCLIGGGCDVRASASIMRHGHRVVVASGGIRLHGLSPGRITLRLRPVGLKIFRRDHRRMRVTVRVAIGVSGAANMTDSESVLVV
jgi:protocatechuate 3,4-dioxygenase beta subunit